MLSLSAHLRNVNPCFSVPLKWMWYWSVMPWCNSLFARRVWCAPGCNFYTLGHHCCHYCCSWRCCFSLWAFSCLCSSLSGVQAPYGRTAHQAHIWQNSRSYSRCVLPMNRKVQFTITWHMDIEISNSILYKCCAKLQVQMIPSISTSRSSTRQLPIMQESTMLCFQIQGTLLVGRDFSNSSIS